LRIPDLSRAARRLAEGALAALLPADCLLCGTYLPWRQKGSVCLPCWGGVRWTPGYRPAPPDGVVWAADYDGDVRRLIQAYKFEALDYLGPPLGEAAAAALRPLLGGPALGGRSHGALPRCDVVVPVPLHFWRQCRRGFNQSLLLAQTLGRELGLPVAARLLARPRAGRRQVGLGRAERLRALAGCFAAPPGRTRGLRVLLVDDVMTTGATLQACAAALRRAGAASVLGCVVARTP
jgi:ComF family protein